MTLLEIRERAEKLCAAADAFNRPGFSLAPDIAERVALARACLAMLPVVEMASGWCDSDDYAPLDIYEAVRAAREKLESL